MKELELRLDKFRVDWENERIIDRSYGEMIAPKVQAESRWVTTGKGIGRELRNPLWPHPTKTHIPFWLVLVGRWRGDRSEESNSSTSQMYGIRRASEAQ